MNGLLLWVLTLSTPYLDDSEAIAEANRVCAAVFRAPAMGDVRRLEGAYGVCLTVATTALREGVDPVLAVAVAYQESRLRDIPSARGSRLMAKFGSSRSSLPTSVEQGALQIKPRWHCPKARFDGCDTTLAGVRLLKSLIGKHKEAYRALAHYRRPRFADYGYAGRVQARMGQIRKSMKEPLRFTQKRLPPPPEG